LALEAATEKLSFAMGVVGHLESVKTTPELRAAYNAVCPKLSAFYSAISLNEKLWRQIKRYAETDEARALTGLRARLILPNHALHASVVRFDWRGQVREFRCEPEAWFADFVQGI
jgi:Zn-dependent oligopeptidase